MGLLEEGQRYAKKKRYIYTRLLILDEPRTLNKLLR